MRSLCLLMTLALLSPGCVDPENRRAKERIFSPEEPASEILRAKEALDLARAKEDPALWSRLWTMDRAETAARIGSHRSKAEVSFRWTRGGRVVSLKEEQHLAISREGAFHARIENDQDAGMEFVWTGDAAFARSRYGSFRPRRIDRAQQDAWREEAVSALRTVFELSRGRIVPASDAVASAGGRDVRTFQLRLGEKKAAAGVKLPAPVFGKVRGAEGELVDGPDEDTGRRLEFDERVELEVVGGELQVDERTGVVLSARIDARYSVPGSEEGAPSRLDVSVSFSLTPDAAVSVAAPDDALPSDIPHAVNDPLWFVGDSAPEPVEEPDAD